MSISVRPSIKSIFETGSGGCRYYVIWYLIPMLNNSLAEKIFS